MKTRKMKRILGLLLVLCLALSGCHNSTNVHSHEYVDTINKAAKDIPGDIDWGVHCYVDDFRYVSDSNPVKSASVIKLFIMEYAFYMESCGKLTMDEKIQGMTVTELLEKMITESDNDATNTFIDYFGMPELNHFIAGNGYKDTKLERKMLDAQAVEQGKENYTSVNDVLSFLDKLYDNKEKYPYSEMLDIMKRQTRVNKIQAKIPRKVVIANKTGELSDVENDVGIVFTEKGDVAMVFLCSSLSEPGRTRAFISDSAYLIYKKLIPWNQRYFSFN